MRDCDGREDEDDDDNEDFEVEYINKEHRNSPLVEGVLDDMDGRACWCISGVVWKGNKNADTDDTVMNSANNFTIIDLGLLFV